MIPWIPIVGYVLRFVFSLTNNEVRSKLIPDGGEFHHSVTRSNLTKWINDGIEGVLFVDLLTDTK